MRPEIERLRRAWRFYAAEGITIERILTDNGGCYRSRDFAATYDELDIGHHPRRTTPPAGPRRDGGSTTWVPQLRSSPSAL